MPVSLSQLRDALAPAPFRVQYEGASFASVAAVLLPGNDLLFMQRAHRHGDPWSGHLSFPGGKVERADPSTLAAAVRETREELGLHLPEHSFLGELDETPTVNPLPRMIIRAYLFALDELPELTPNEEVASVHTLSLRDLLLGRGRGEMTFDFRGHPVVMPEVRFDGVHLWGLTLRIVDDLLHRIDGRGIGLDRPRA